MPNPFFYGPYITNPRYFVGRRSELCQIFSALEIAVTGQVQPVAIIGEHRIGKSSLLYHLAQVSKQYLQNPGAYRFIYVDLDDAICQTQAGLLGYILEHLSLDGTVFDPNLITFGAALDRLRQSGGPYPVLCLDEFEHLTQRKAEFPDNFFTALRSWAQSGKVTFVTTSQISLAALFAQSGLNSPFHNIFTQLNLGELTLAEAGELLERGRTCDRPFSSNDCANLHRLAGEHPYALQVAGSLLYQAKVNPALDWTQLKRDFYAQFNFATRRMSRAEKFITGIHRAMVDVRKVPCFLGRFVLELCQNDKASNTTAEILGWIVIVLLFCLVSGMIYWNQFSAIMAALRSLFK